jgi:hypothetical protein
MTIAYLFGYYFIGTNMEANVNSNEKLHSTQSRILEHEV